MSRMYTSLHYGNFIIYDYVNNKRVGIKFLDTGYMYYSTMGNIRKGLVMDRLKPSFAGVGFLGEGIFTPTNQPKAYTHWCNMLVRCYGSDVAKPYAEIEVCKEWHNFQNFTAWAVEQRGFTDPKSQLDKDLKIAGSSIYSKDTCSFIPHRINSLLIKSDVTGFWCEKEKCWYFSYRNENGAKIRKKFLNPDQGAEWYMKEKSRVVKILAEKYKNVLDPVVYDSLYSWKF